MSIKIISVEGNIGSGKSTLVEGLKQKYKAQEHICFLQEPVDEWSCVRDNDGKTILEKYYGNQERYAFSFQMMAYISRLAQLKNAIKKGYQVIITERCVYTDKMVFAQMLYDDKKIEDVEYQIYMKWFSEFLDDIPEFHYVYVKTSPNVAHTRVNKRSRTGECNIPLSYLQKCHDYHERWMETIPPHHKLYLKGDIDTEKFPDEQEKWFGLIYQYLSDIKQKEDAKSNKKYTLMFDGASRGNPGPSGCGFVIYENDTLYNSPPSSQILFQGSKYLDKQTNNYAEYSGLLLGLIKASSLGIKQITVKGDSLLVINQLIGTYKVKSTNLENIYQKTKNATLEYSSIEFCHVNRSLNKLADTLANNAIDNNLSN
jgi:deoxyadenosine/deoxycytidine kinase/ribonuclease HI